MIAVVTVLIPALSYSLACTIMNYQANAAQLQTNPNNWILLLSNFSGTASKPEIQSYIMAAAILVFMVMVPILAKIAIKIVNNFYAAVNPYAYPQMLSVLLKCEKMLDDTDEQIIKVINEWYEIEMKLNGK